MADPFRKEPSSPQKGSGSGSEDRSREHAVIPGGGSLQGSVPSPNPIPPAANPQASHPPTVGDGMTGARPRKKKKEKMGKGVMMEEPGKKKKKFASLDNLPGRARTCSVCRREFPTARALFGHMRSHPERIWRGAHPPPVSPRREAEERTVQAQELTRSLLNIGQMILTTSKFKEKEGFQAGIGSSSGAVSTAHGAKVEIGTTKGQEKGAKVIQVFSKNQSGTSSWDSYNQRKTTGKGSGFTDEGQRKRIHSQIDLNKEARADDDDDDDETPGVNSSD